MTMNAFTCSDSVLIPMFADLFSIQGLAQLFNTIQAIQVYTNKDLKIDGILINQFQANTKVNQKISNELAKISQEQQIPIYQTKIRQGTAIRQQQVQQDSIFNSSSNVARDFELFIEEYLRKEKQNQSESVETTETLDS
jgi:chromosome partitioning protein